MVSEEVKALLKAIKDNTMSGQIDTNMGIKHMAVVPLQYIADELEEVSKD